MVSRAIKFLSIMMVVCFPSMGFAQEKDGSNLFELGAGATFSNYNLDLIGGETMPTAGTILWGKINPENWFAEAELKIDGKYNVVGYTVRSKADLLSLGRLRVGVGARYYENMPRVSYEYERLSVAEMDSRRFAVVSVGAGAGVLNKNHLRVDYLFGYVRSVRSAKLIAGGIQINGQKNGLHYDQLFKDELFMSGTSLSGGFGINRISISGSLDYYRGMSPRTTITPDTAVYLDGLVLVKLIGKLSFVGGGMYTNEPLGYRGSGYYFAGTSYRF